MKRQATWMTTLFMVLLALCCMARTARAQTPQNLPPYYSSAANNLGNTVSVVIRIKQDLSVSGAYTTDRPPAAYAITGRYDPANQQLITTMTLPPAYADDDVIGYLDGSYDVSRNAFSLTYTPVQDGQQGEPEPLANASPYVGDLPLMVGIWQWEATDSISSTAVEFIAGEFYILEQSKDGKIVGQFSNRTVQDTGAIDGEVKSGFRGTDRIDLIEFTRSIRRADGQGLELEQLWSAQVGVDGTIQNGFIEQKVPGIWGARWTARPY
jgi:hypothetical protein